MRAQGPVTLVLDSATDAPARPVPKAPLTEEQKQKAKEKLAARQKNREQRVSAATSGAGTPVTASASEVSLLDGTDTPASSTAAEERVAAEADKAPAQATTEKSEKELIHEAEEKSRELAERFKVAMLEPVP